VISIWILDDRKTNFIKTKIFTAWHVSIRTTIWYTVEHPIVDTSRSNRAIFAGIEPLHNGHWLGVWRRKKKIGLVENTSILSRTLELRRKLHLFVSIQQSRLYILIFHLKLQLTDIYLDSKVIEDNSIKDYFNKSWSSDFHKTKEHGNRSKNLF